MSAISTPTAPAHTVSTNGAAAATHNLSDPGYQAFWLLRIAFTVAPILFGLDKYFNVLVNWEKYLASWINDILPGTATTGMYIVGGVEMLAGVLVFLKPRYAAYIVAAWLGGVIPEPPPYPGLLHNPPRD